MNDGLFQELVIQPSSIVENEDGKTTYITDPANDKTLAVTRRGARSSLFLYLRSILRDEIPGVLSRPAIWSWTPQERTERMNLALELHRKQGNPRTFKLLFDAKGDVIAITTDQHIQIAYSTIASAVEEAIQKVIPDTEFTDRGLDRYWTYSLPVQSEYVRTHVGIDAGVNRPRGRCAVYIYTRMEVIWTGRNDRQSPCHKLAYVS